ncbi:hypothetical protein KIPB_014215, partial [Kipferlia bialata]
GSDIRKSLFSLGQLLTALKNISAGKTMNAIRSKFRESNLTKLLQPHLDPGSSMASTCVMYLNVHGHPVHYTSTKQAIRLGSVSQNIRLQNATSRVASVRPGGYPSATPGRRMPFATRLGRTVNMQTPSRHRNQASTRLAHLAREGACTPSLARSVRVGGANSPLPSSPILRQSIMRAEQQGIEFGAEPEEQGVTLTLRELMDMQEEINRIH